jgi:hypothetical protein
MRYIQNDNFILALKLSNHGLIKTHNLTDTPSD